MTTGLQNQKVAVDSAQWLLYRYNPDRAAQGENPLVLDSRAPKAPLDQYLGLENRFKMLTKTHPDVARKLFTEAQRDVMARWRMYEYLAARAPEGAEQ
jgi:pyruvate-ferredoxin/flavodoxin oxidoreductase